MCSDKPLFAAVGYEHLTEFLDLENCAQLTAQLKQLVAEGKTRKDEQCPLSEAVHGAPVFDSLLEQLLPHFEQATGKRLYPTYAYARLYAPGDELKVHTDRPACEISATLTLGFEGTPWPIYMADKVEGGEEFIDSAGDPVQLGNISEITMAVGDAVIYRGMKKVHWRNKFEGEWQAQVFLHYVDADGPHANQKYDGRAKLSHHDLKPEPVDMTFWSYPDALPLDACKKLIESAEKAETEKAGVGSGDTGVVDLEIRDVNRINLPSYRGIGATMAGIGMNANQQAWRFEITHSNQTDYLKYDINGHYHAHVDTFMSRDYPECRKLTVLAFLNDDFEGGKLFLQTGDKKIYPPQTPGSVLVFPSFILHGVEPVTKGIRRSIVTWLVGPFFR
jgi:predicted 2-oxoglutarate/Fe(II)-dependent dioxygenase YbiX